MPFGGGEGAVANGFVGTMVIACQTHGASVSPFGCPADNRNVTHGAHARTERAACASVVITKGARGCKKTHEQGIYYSRLYPCKASSCYGVYAGAAFYGSCIR